MVSSVEIRVKSLLTVNVVHELVRPLPLITVGVHHEEHPERSYHRVGVARNALLVVNITSVAIHLQNFRPV